MTIQSRKRDTNSPSITHNFPSVFYQGVSLFKLLDYTDSAYTHTYPQAHIHMYLLLPPPHILIVHIHIHIHKHIYTCTYFCPPPHILIVHIHIHIHKHIYKCTYFCPPPTYTDSAYTYIIIHKHIYTCTSFCALSPDIFFLSNLFCSLSITRLVSFCRKHTVPVNVQVRMQDLMVRTITR